VQKRVQKILDGIIKSDRVASAYLFLGPPGAGKMETAGIFADLLGCKKQDRFSLAPSGSTVKIEQVRELQGWIRYGPSASRYLAVTVEAADKLTDQAAAAFLKTLEEPPAGVVFILIAEREDKLPATILSRCQRIIFAEGALHWKPDVNFNPFYEEVRNISRKGVLERLLLSARLEKEKERIEDLLYDLTYFARIELSGSDCARIILDSLRYLKRKANVRLVLDNMCLRLGGREI
jgi:DNA polymerase III delta prime subunit